MNYLRELKLTNFRCFDTFNYQFSSKINILTGNNAVGKTSIVEAIHCLALLKSHRTNDDKQLIKDGKDYTVVIGRVEDNLKTNEIIYSITNKGKKIVFNSKPYSNLSEYIGYLSVVMFCPEDLELVKGGPSFRRKFLDTNLSQISSFYLKQSINYKKILKERNEILSQIVEKNTYDENLLNIYTDSLFQDAKNIINTRKRFIELLNPYVKRSGDIISDGKETIQIEYLPSVTAENVESAIKNNLNQDIFYKTTTKGPHRDDFLITINGKDAKDYASQGQQRTAVLAIKLALAEIIKEKNQNLIIILDDVFSELDLNRQNQIINLLNNKNQIFITTTSIQNLSEKVLSESLVLNLSKESEASGESRTKEQQ